MTKNSKTPYRLMPIYDYFLNRNIEIPSSNQFINNKRNEIGNGNGNLRTSELIKIIRDLKAKASEGEFFVG